MLARLDIDSTPYASGGGFTVATSAMAFNPNTPPADVTPSIPLPAPTQPANGGGTSIDPNSPASDVPASGGGSGFIPDTSQPSSAAQTGGGNVGGGTPAYSGGSGASGGSGSSAEAVPAVPNYFTGITDLVKSMLQTGEPLARQQQVGAPVAVTSSPARNNNALIGLVMIVALAGGGYWLWKRYGHKAASAARNAV